MNTFSLNHYVSVALSMLTCYVMCLKAQRIAHIPLNICKGRKMNTFSSNNVKMMVRTALENAHILLNRKLKAKKMNTFSLSICLMVYVYGA